MTAWAGQAACRHNPAACDSIAGYRRGSHRTFSRGEASAVVRFDRILVRLIGQVSIIGAAAAWGTSPGTGDRGTDDSPATTTASRPGTLPGGGLADGAFSAAIPTGTPASRNRAAEAA